jgi:hypothetical protein
MQRADLEGRHGIDVLSEYGSVSWMRSGHLVGTEAKRTSLGRHELVVRDPMWTNQSARGRIES